MQAVEVKLNLQKQKLMEENNKKIRLEKARRQPVVKRDPSRLYQLTSGWEQRLKQPKDHEGTSYSLSAMPKRYTDTCYKIRFLNENLLLGLFQHGDKGYSGAKLYDEKFLYKKIIKTNHYMPPYIMLYMFVFPPQSF